MEFRCAITDKSRETILTVIELLELEPLRVEKSPYAGYEIFIPIPNDEWGACKIITVIPIPFCGTGVYCYANWRFHKCAERPFDYWEITL